jgi:hypothetical protein
METSSIRNITREVGITVALKFENCNINVTAGKKIVYIIQSRSFCASPSYRPRLRLGLQSLGLAQKDSFLLFMI